MDQHFQAGEVALCNAVFRIYNDECIHSQTRSVFRHLSRQISLRFNSSPTLPAACESKLVVVEVVMGGAGLSIISSLRLVISLSVSGQQIHKSIMVLSFMP